MLTESPRTVLNRIGERGHPCHVSSLREKVCSFSASRMKLAVFGSCFLPNECGSPLFLICIDV